MLRAAVTPHSDQAALLLGLEESVASMTVVPGRDGNGTLDILVSRAQRPLLQALLRCSKIPFTITMLDLQRAIDLENVETNPQPEPRSSCAGKVGLSWSSYHPYSTHAAYLDCLATDQAGLVSLHRIGTSSEGRPLQLVQISSGGSGKRALWVDGGIHAREW